MAKKPTPPVAPTERAPEHDLLKVIATDEYRGQGGSYVFDPATGKRTPAQPKPEQET